MQILEEGNLHETAVIERLRNDGWIISRQQEELEIELKGFGVIIQMHPDGIIQWPGDDPLVLEVKSMGESSFRDWKARGWGQPGLIQKYKWQVSVMMNRLHMPLMFVVKNRNTGEIDTDFVRLPFYTMSDIVSRITTIEVAAKNSNLPEKCDYANYPCPYNYLHEEEAEIELGDDELSELVASYINIRDERDRLVKECKDILGEIKEKGKGKKISLPFATVSSVEKTTVSYDIDKMRENGIDVEAYEKIDLSRFVTVRRKKVKEDNDSDSSSLQE